MNTNLWKITSYNEYVTSYKSVCGPKFKMTTFYKSLGFTDPEQFFNTMAYQVQQIANDRVCGVLDVALKTDQLHQRVINLLKLYTYRAIDHIRYNDKIIAENTRLSTSINNNGAVTSTTIPASQYWEQIVGSSALRAWQATGLEKAVNSYLADKGWVYLLDDSKFYDKNEIDVKVGDIYNRINLERDYIDHEIERVDEKIDTGLALKQNIADQKLYQQDINGTGDPELLGQFDEILVQSQNPQNAVVDLPTGKKRAIIKFDTSQLIDASVFNTSDQNDTTNAIGRVWAYNTEQQVNLNESEIKATNINITTNLDPIKRMIRNPFKENINDVYQFNIMSVYYDSSAGGFMLPRYVKAGEQYIIGCQSKVDRGENVIITPLVTVGKQQRFVRSTLFGGGDNTDLYIKVSVVQNVLTVERVEYNADENGNVKRTMQNVSARYNVVVFFREYNNEYSPDYTVENVVQQHIPLLLNAGRNWPYNESKSYFADINRKSTIPEYVTLDEITPIKQTVDILKPIVKDLKSKDDFRLEALKEIDQDDILAKIRELTENGE